MSYTKHTWEPGEFISSEWLNHIEEGIEAVDTKSDDAATTEEVLEYLGITASSGTQQ